MEITPVIAAVVGGVLFSGQAGYLSSNATPPVSFWRGCRMVVSQVFSVVLSPVLRSLRAVGVFLSTLWVLETLKNLFQALLLSGPGLAHFWLPKDSSVPAVSGVAFGLPRGVTWEMVATVAGFLVIGFLMGVVTKRAEKFREEQAQATHAELLAQHHATQRVLPDVQRELADVKAEAAPNQTFLVEIRQKV